MLLFTSSELYTASFSLLVVRFNENAKLLLANARTHKSPYYSNLLQSVYTYIQMLTTVSRETVLISYVPTIGTPRTVTVEIYSASFKRIWPVLTVVI